MAMSWIMMLLMSNPLGGLLSHPPRDLASLLDPAAVLQKLEVQTSEPALIALLRTNAAAASKADAEEGDTLYVKKLMAIRLIEKNKAAAVLPVLEEVAAGPDVTLRDAAGDAIAAINGKPSPRPGGAALLKELAGRLPPDTGFVVALDFARDAKATTVGEFMENALKALEPKVPANPPADPNAPPAPADPMQQQMKMGITAAIPQVEEGLIRALGIAGNVRLDAAVFVLSSSAGVIRGDDCMAFVAKGLCDPERIGRLLKSDGNLTERQCAGKTIYTARNGVPQLCLLDANTFVFAPAQGPNAAAYMNSLVAALAAPQQTPARKEFAAAFDLVMQSKARLAAAGAFSPEQKKVFGTDLLRNLQPHEGESGPQEEIMFAGSQLLLDLVKAETYVVAMDVEGKLSVQANCTDAPAAAALGKSSAKLQQLFFDMIAKEAGNAPAPFRPIIDQFTKAGGLWKTEVAEKTVTLKMDSLMTLVAPWFGLRATVRHGPDVHRGPPVMARPMPGKAVPVQPAPNQ